MVVKVGEGWIYDDWPTDGNIGNTVAPDVDIGGGASGSGRWDSILSIGRRLFSRGKEGQSSLGRALFNVERSSIKPLESVLVPLIDRQSGEDNLEEDGKDDKIARDVFRNNSARSATSASGCALTSLQLSRIPLEPGEYDACAPRASRNLVSERLGTSSYEVDVGDLKPGVFIPLEDLDLGSSADWSVGDGATRMSWIGWMRSMRDWRSAGSPHWLSLWWQKVLEVLPVLAVVTLGVIGTFLYLLVADGWWQLRRGAFSLSCDVGEGEWVRSLDRPLYSATCPYIRDSWNCHKYGWATAGFSLGSDSAMGIGIGLGTWRWEPTKCTIPRFEAHEFLRAMRNRHVAFVGDQSAANAFDSMVCMLAEAGAPRLISPSRWIGTRKGSGVSNVEEGSSADSGNEEEASFRDPDSSEKAAWGGWGFHWGGGKRNSSDAGSASEQVAMEEEGWGSREMHYSFHSHNFTLSLYLSPFLVETTTDSPVNASHCQLSKEAQPRVLPRPTTASQPEWADEVIAACYPNKVAVDLPDPLWASDAATIDVLILNSGRDWREEEVESQGLGFFKQGERQPQYSVEGYRGLWAYPIAMTEVGAWLANGTNFKGQAILRSYAPGHSRRECAGKMMVMPDAVRGSSIAEEAERYNTAMVGAVKGPRLRFSNVSAVGMQRGDGHPWMATPARPTPDCTNWCLPGVPDVWNEVTAAEVLLMYGDGQL